MVKIFIIMWVLVLPIATVIDAYMFESPATRQFVSYGIPDNVFYAFLLQNVHETFIFSLGMLLGYLLYRKDIYKWFK